MPQKEIHLRSEYVCKWMQIAVRVSIHFANVFKIYMSCVLFHRSKLKERVILLKYLGCWVNLRKLCKHATQSRQIYNIWNVFLDHFRVSFLTQNIEVFAYQKRCRYSQTWPTFPSKDVNVDKFQKEICQISRRIVLFTQTSDAGESNFETTASSKDL